MQIKILFTRKVLHTLPRFESDSFWNSAVACCTVYFTETEQSFDLDGKTFYKGLTSLD